MLEFEDTNAITQILLTATATYLFIVLLQAISKFYNILYLDEYDSNCIAAISGAGSPQVSRKVIIASVLLLLRTHIYLGKILI